MHTNSHASPENREEWRGKEGGTEGGELEPEKKDQRRAGGGEPTRRRRDEVEPWRSSGRRRIEETRRRAIAARARGAVDVE